MNQFFRTTRPVGISICLGAIVLLTGCLDQGFLVTPVTTNRSLRETELFRDAPYSADKIALIDVSGVIANAPAFKLLGEGEHSVSRLLEQLEKAAQDRRVKAVILRINSPGGTVVGSELMHDEITHFRRSTGKPVIAVMMDVAASGGYYIACACDEIVAQPSTITGSIGVIMQMVDVSGTARMIGVKTDAITSGPLKDIGSPFREMTAEERELFQAIVDDMFSRFVDVVVAGRPRLDEETVRKLADGRVYTAGQALEVGLIDRIASLREVVALTKERVGIDRVKVVTYKRPLEYRPNYYARSPAGPSPQINLLNLNWPGWLENTAPRFLYLWSPGVH